ncbi:MAG: energy-coupling factor ABC transporter permease [Muribaculaceae bacterium]|nr:energy-coupling factor ABC transporter permease [Muribaculaceae bacterium]
MHMNDALVSPAVAVTGGIIATTLIALASRKLKNLNNNGIVPLMGVMGAFVFAAQMINFTIPGTGSSGHLIGGILLSAVLGPWAAFISLCSVIIVQCLVFADGGLLALGCNIVNMAATSCLIGYPLCYRPIAGSSLKPWRIVIASVVASIVALEIGAFGVTLETEFSGITSLPFVKFLRFMLPIHFVIGLIEGLATAAVLVFMAKYQPSVFNLDKSAKENSKLQPAFLMLGVLTVLFAVGFTWMASDYPDGLEWSIEKASSMFAFSSAKPATAIMPDYDSSLAGIVGSVIVMVMIWAITNIIFSRLSKSKQSGI